jgi:hypothetical protein
VQSAVAFSNQQMLVRQEFGQCGRWEFYGKDVDSAYGNVRFRKFRMYTIKSDQTIKAEQLIDRFTTASSTGRLCS